MTRHLKVRCNDLDLGSGLSVDIFCVQRENFSTLSHQFSEVYKLHFIETKEIETSYF